MRKIWITWLAGVALFILATYVNTHYFRVENILDIEFATTNTTLGDCIHEISPNATTAYQRLLQNTIVDYVYLLAYTLVLIFSVVLTLDALELKTSKWMFAICILPGLMDLIENAYLIATAVNQQPSISWFYVLVVRIKWAVAIPFFMLFPVVVIYGLVILFRARQTTNVKAA